MSGKLPHLQSVVNPQLGYALPYVVLLLVTLVIFMGQNESVGFENGHHGWVSAHGLAIMSKAILKNHFVGYTLQFKDDTGHKQYYYFDRYPVFFSVAMNGLLASVGRDLSMKVFATREAMNVIFVATMLIALGLVNTLTNNRYIALSVVLMTFASYTLLYYKDMVHYDQPGLLGFLLLIWAIALYKLKGKRWVLYVATIVAVGLGRGYASYAVLIVWNLLEAFHLAQASAFSLVGAAKEMIKHDAFMALVVGLIWGSSLLAYNIYTESKIRDIPIYQTSVVDSALRRLSLNEDFNTEHSDELKWGNFFINQVERVVDLIIPLGHNQLGPFKYLILIPMIILIPQFIKQQQSPSIKMMMVIMVLSGFFWLFPMKSLAAFHDYTRMFYVSLSLIFYLAVFSARMIRGYGTYLLILSAMVFFSAHFLVNQAHTIKSESINEDTYDFNRIAQIIEREKNVYYPEGHRNIIDGVPYVVGFYLPDSYITSLDMADYIISTDKNYQADSLTPSNKKIFLFKKQPHTN